MRLHVYNQNDILKEAFVPLHFDPICALIMEGMGESRPSYKGRDCRCGAEKISGPAGTS